MVTEKYFHNLDVEGLSCELVGQDLNGKPYRLVRVHGLTAEWAKKNKLTSGLTTLFSNKAQINDKTGQLIFPPGDKIKVCILTFQAKTTQLSCHSIDQNRLYSHSTSSQSTYS
jgi:hypothetical protein